MGSKLVTPKVLPLNPYLVALIILIKSGLSDAPPTKEPSMSGQAANSRQLAAVTDPPYRIRVDSATWVIFTGWY